MTVLVTLSPDPIRVTFLFRRGCWRTGSPRPG